jgi:hypothetical protein
MVIRMDPGYEPINPLTRLSSMRPPDKIQMIQVIAHPLLETVVKLPHKNGKFSCLSCFIARTPVSNLTLLSTIMIFEAKRSISLLYILKKNYDTSFPIRKTLSPYQ